MTRRSLDALTIATGLAMSACASSAPPAKEATMTTPSAATPSQPMMPVKEWPLRFKSHSFSVNCYDTYACKVNYADLLQRNDDPDKLRPSSSTYKGDYRRNWSGTHAMIRNFPSPALVSWRSKDGQAHRAEIDIGEIFSDQVIRHNVPRDEMLDVPGGIYRNEPSIILEVNDRTIRVWMRAHVPTKQLQKPGNKYSDFRNDLILAKTYHY